MEELRDIRDLDPISIWPLAMGWWVILALILTSLAAVILVMIKKNNFKQSWKFQALQKLQKLRQKHLNQSTVKDMFELLKEVAILKFGRKNCANLTGNDWLKWLEANDKTKFKWLENGKQLVDLQYKPCEAPLSKEFEQKLVIMFNGIETLVK